MWWTTIVVVLAVALAVYAARRCQQANKVIERILAARPTAEQEADVPPAHVLGLSGRGLD
jgi:hypothetical protein